MQLRLRAIAFTCVLAFVTVSCGTISEEEKNQDLGPLNPIDAANLTEIMLTVSDPDDAVDYFQASLAEEPERVDYKRGLARSLARAGRYREAAISFEALDEEGSLNQEDRLIYAEVLIRENEWDRAEAQLALVRGGSQSYRYNLLNALLADNYENWDLADRYYAEARRLTTQPAAALNNWGISYLSRGDNFGAIRIFEESIQFDPSKFGPKNNLVIARGLTGNYQLPVIPLTEEERARLYHNLAVVALRRGDEDVAKGLLQSAVDEHPRYFAPAADKLAALQSVVGR